ncbi:phosphopantetheinyl transferase [Nocardioides thalensis]|uniref:Phosphopantetheinyl transferase n=1 Tax=Nocardioides thalensis TaxID=1914755 RepID=A0A853BYM0_9ACTN|nr:4'-phosphopantetheinyl transferase superfamily protein [Nocardioides thalensis]NYJ00154.1 phosphopantetheinyl transferase [Nocardioides thalensis]
MTVVRFLAVDEALAGPALRLTATEQARHDRLRAERDRRSYRAAHRLVRLCVAELVGGDAADVELAQECPECRLTDHGRPYVVGAPDVHVSLSHTRGWVAAMASDAPCGIDVEQVREVSAGVPRRVLSAAEQAWVADQGDPTRAFAVLWARKEALVKAGVGSIDDAARLDALTDARLRDWAEAPADAAGSWVRLSPAAP